MAIVKTTLRTIYRIPQLRIGVTLLVLLVLAAVLAPVLAPFKPMALESPLAAPPSARNPLGTDGLGRTYPA